MGFKKVSLDKDFIKVNDNLGHVYYGGDQGWLKQKFAKKAGCGAVAISNVSLYMEGKHNVTLDEFVAETDFARRRMPVIPFLGMNPLMVSIALTSIFKKRKINRLAFCNILPINIYKKITKMISCGYPVVLAIGRNFPLIGGKKKLRLYTKNVGELVFAQEVNAHFVTVTAIDSELLTISSWGKKYYIKRNELTRYGWLNSSWLFTNIIRII